MLSGSGLTKHIGAQIAANTANTAYHIAWPCASAQQNKSFDKNWAEDPKTLLG